MGALAIRNCAIVVMLLAGALGFYSAFTGHTELAYINAALVLVNGALASYLSRFC